jgi:hypothetical protein
MLFEIPGSKEMLAELRTWSDLTKMETVPVVETEEVFKLAKVVK